MSTDKEYGLDGIARVVELGKDGMSIASPVSVTPYTWTFPNAPPTTGQVPVALDNAGTMGYSSAGTGDVAGPASSTDNAVVRFDSTTGKVIQNSVVTISDGGVISNGSLSGNATTATTLATTRAIYGNNFDGSAALTGVIASTYGGTGNGFSKLSGATTSEKTYTLPNASTTILTTNDVVTVPQGGSGLTSTTAYAVLCGGTTSTAALQPIASVGTAGQVLTSNGAGALPTMQDSSTSSVKAWVNFNGTGTVAIRASLNTSSITDNGTGDYTQNFTSNISDANYGTFTTIKNTNGDSVSPIKSGTTPTTSAVTINTYNANTGAAGDTDYVNVLIIR